ncbi:MAG: primosomal protein N' [Chloroflexota bacterium]
MFAELVINVEVPLEGTFHYDVARDLASQLQIGHLVEVEFGRRLAQGIVVGLGETAPVDETKPVIALIDDVPVVQPWQIRVARWLSQAYLTPLNACLRLMLPPGLTRWADVIVDLNPYWDGNGRLTELQQKLIDLLREKGDLRGRQIGRALGAKSKWKTAVNQLARRKIVRKATRLDPPRIRPKQVRTAELIVSVERMWTAVNQLGRRNKKADVLHYLATSEDPLLEETAVLAATEATQKHLDALLKANLVTRSPAQTTAIPLALPENPSAELQTLISTLPAPISNLQSPIPFETLAEQNIIQLLEEPATLSLAISAAEAIEQVMVFRNAKAYYRVLQALREAAQPVSISQLYADFGVNINHLRKLAKLDLIRLGAEEVWRDSLADRDFVPAEAPMLTSDQARAWGRLKVQMMAIQDDYEDLPDFPGLSDIEAPQSAVPILLHGVTGSGKTEIYMRAIDFAIRSGQQAMVLVPEIALTPQTVRRFAARFPGRVAVMHSRLSDGERYDTWRRARQGLFDIIVGPRSAMFMPFKNLGVIVLDEEHDGSYKQTPPVPPPYYHARTVAMAMGRIVGAAVILGSATPDVVTYHRARSGIYRLLELPKRVMGHRQRIEAQAERLQIESRYRETAVDPDDALTIPLPPIQVVDLRQELRAGNRSIFSRALEKALTETLERGEQAILFLNRRGTATFVICRDCGHVLKCPRCDMPLTYHQPRMMLACHHCGRQEPPHGNCPQCQSRRIKYFGLGTEKVEEEVQLRWPEARITRWDRDTTAGRNTHETLLASFVNQEANVLVGTQMIAKGLDLPLVTLVGVISADVSLGLPDYRTGERAFQVLAQVAGRAGRGLLGGRVIIQTYQPEHYAIQAAAEHDYAAFYVDEIRFRTQHTLPPFRRLAKLVLVDPMNDRGRYAAERLAQGLRLHVREQELAATEILGPVPPFFNRIDGRFRWQIIIRTPDPIRLLADFPVPHPWQVDIDPVSTL